MSSAEVPSPDESGTPRTRPELSVTQIVASTLAAVTATIAASYFGVSGTVIGAALASVVTVVGNAVYSHSIRRTRERVLSAVPVRPDAFRRLPARTEAAAADPVLARRPFTWRKAALAAAGLFLIVAGIVTSIELAAGRPLTKVIHDQSGSGTSLFGGGTKKSSPTPSPSPSPSPSAPTTPTAHPSTDPGSTAPTSSPTTPTPTPTTPTPTPTTSTPTSPDPTPTPTPTPSTSTTGHPTP